MGACPVTCNQRRERETLIPVKNHPKGRTMISIYQAKRREKDGKAVIHENVCHWFNFATHDAERGYYGPTKGELRIKTGDTGFVGVQLEQGL